MRVAAYAHLHRARSPTGVGKHIIHMIRGLAGRSSIDLSVMSPGQELDRDGKIPLDIPLAGLPAVRLWQRRRPMEFAWAAMGHPRVEHWLETDWVYCPAEVYVPTRRAKLAATIHCVNWFEPELPWYGSPATRRARRRLQLQWRRITDRADRVITVSEFLKSRITALFRTDPSRIFVVGNGVEEEYFQAGRDRSGLQPGAAPYVMVVGGLTERKGADYVLAVAAELARRWPELTLQIAGECEPQFRDRAAALPNLKMLGYVGVDALPELLAGSVAMLFLSRYETFGIPAAEAMAAGTPAVVSSFAGLPEVVGDGGVIVDATDTATIVDQFLRLTNDLDYRAATIARGRRRAEQFHWSSAVDKLVAAMS